MCKRIIHLTLFVFVLGLIPAGTLEAADASLQLWLEFEDNANDSSNYARPIFQEDAPVYIDGVVGRATDLRGEDYIAATGWKGVTGTSAFTIAAWINSGDGAGTIVGWGTARGVNEQDIQFRTANTGTLRIGNGSGNIRMTTKVHDNEWHHIAVTVAENGTMSLTDVILYLDGFDDTNPTAGTRDGSAFNIPATGYDVRIGKEYDDPAGTWERRWNGDIDDLRIYNRELSANEIRDLAGAAGPILTAPDDDAVLGQQSATLEWAAGAYAADVDGHEVFLSEVFEDVDSGAPAASQGLTDNDWYFSLLDNGKTYYWKIDAVNDLHATGRWSSEIRSFFVPPLATYNPSPADTAAFVNLNATLSWEPGLGAVLQHVYFGDDFADVSAGTGGTDQGQQPGTEFTPPTLASEMTYYWRIDTVTTSGTEPGAVWSFTTEPDLPLTDDPNLVGYWKLDINEPSATVAVDHSGYDNHGSLRDDAHFVAGYIDEAVLLDGDGDYVNIDGYKGVLGTSSFSVVAWIKTSSMVDISIIGWGTGGGARFNFRTDDNNATEYSVRYSNGDGNVQGNTAVNDGEWHHIGVTVVGGYNADSQYVRIYTDGLDDTRESVDTTSDLDIVAGEDLGIGSRPDNSTSFFDGLIDEVRLYDRVLSAVEVARLMDPSKAVNPTPVNGARDVERTPTLAWTPGIDESTGGQYTKHNVYFSTSFEDVNSGSVMPFVVEGPNQYAPGLLDYYEYYYWRVDGIDAVGQAYRGFIWNFKVTYDPTQIVDPNLRAWYKFDGDVADSSGYGRDMIATGEPGYADGMDDMAIVLDGVDDWAAYEFPTEQWTNYTVMAWAKLDGLDAADFESVFSNHHPNNNFGFQIDVNDSDDTYRFNNVGNEDGTFGPIGTEWVHLAVTFDSLRATLFYNGSFVETVFTAENTFNQFATGITRSRGTGRYGGQVDDLRVYDRELTDPEIVAAMRGNLALAWNPDPGDGAVDVDRNVVLSWSPGDGATAHTVYFGADDPANMVEVAGPQVGTTYDPPGSLDLGTTYYWFVVESPGGETGRTWKFTTAEYLVLDDMESYVIWSDPAGPHIFVAWRDGFGDCTTGNGNDTGSVLTENPSPVLGGIQSMKYEFDNDGTVYSPCTMGQVPGRHMYSRIEAQTATLPSGISSDWAGNGIKAISLNFYGTVGNPITESLWVQLKSPSGYGNKILYGTYDGEDIADMNEESWHEWFIDLADFGVDLENVVSISIGVGTEGSAVPGGSGTLYFDDIRLYGSRCLPDRAKPRADFDNSCDVGFGDLRWLFDDWALSTYDFIVTTPSADNLEAHYEFEDNLLDTVGGHHADPCGMVSYAVGRLGAYALSLDGTNHAVATGYQGVLGTQNRTTSAWIKTAGSDAETMMIVNWGSQSGQGHRWAMRLNQPPQDGAGGAIRADIDGGNMVGTTDLRDGEWHHVAAVLQSDGMPRMKNIAIYADGRREALTNRTGRDIDIDTFSENDVTIGAAYWTTDFPFTGLIDDLRIYGRALSDGEIAALAQLAAVGTQLNQPLRPLLTSPEDTDLFPDGRINFVDYATLVDSWLEEGLWPE